MKKFTKFTYIYHRVMLGIVFVISVLGIIFNEDSSIKSDYIFNCVQSGLFLIVSLVPLFMKKLELDIPDFIYFIFIIFCLAHFFCGEILGFYVKVPWWDSALHTFSGMLIALLSFSLINLLNKSNENGFHLNLVFTILFAFSLSLTVGVLWEIIEFASDGITGSNMQRAYVSTMSGRGEGLVGTAAIMDTMKDLILDAIGAAIVCTICSIFVVKKKVKIEDLTLIKKRVKPAVIQTNLASETAQEKIAVSKEESTDLKEEIDSSESYTEAVKTEAEINQEINQKTKTSKKNKKSKTDN